MDIEFLRMEYIGIPLSIKFKGERIVKNATKKDFENYKKNIEDNRIKMVEDMFISVAKQAMKAKEDYEGYEKAGNWNLAVFCYTQYQKNYIKAEAYKAYLDILKNENKESEKNK